MIPMVDFALVTAEDGGAVFPLGLRLDEIEAAMQPVGGA